MHIYIHLYMYKYKHYRSTYRVTRNLMYANVCSKVVNASIGGILCSIAAHHCIKKEPCLLWWCVVVTYASYILTCMYTCIHKITRLQHAYRERESVCAQSSARTHTHTHTHTKTQTHIRECCGPYISPYGDSCFTILITICLCQLHAGHAVTHMFAYASVHANILDTQECTQQHTEHQ